MKQVMATFLAPIVNDMGRECASSAPLMASVATEVSLAARARDRGLNSIGAAGASGSRDP